MARKKEARSVQRKGERELAQLPAGLEEGALPDDRYYDFGNSGVLLTHPSINGGESFQGVFTGYWVTRLTSRAEFAVTRVDARLVLPTLSFRAEGARRAMRVSPGSVFLSLGQFAVPEHLSDVFGSPNRGRFDIRNRTYKATFALNAYFPFAVAEDSLVGLMPANVLLLTVGTVESGGALTAGGLGRILTGLLGGLMFACSHPTKKATTPEICREPHPTGGFHCLLKKDHEPPHANGVVDGTWE